MNLPNNTKPTLDTDALKAIAAQQGVSLQSSDLVSVVAFLEVLMPQLEVMEEMVVAQTMPAGTFLPAKDR